MNRVVVTGMGCVTPIGSTVEGFAGALFAGASGIGPLRAFPEAPSGDPLNPNLRFSRYAEVKDFDPTPLLSSGQIVASDRSAQFAILAARQAVAASGGLLGAHHSERVAIVTGCSTGGRNSEEHETGRLYNQNARVHPLTVIRTMASAGASYIATEHGITGPVLNLSTACSSGTHAIGLAFQMVRAGLATAAIAGGHEAPLTLGFLRAWDSMRVSPTACRPFSADRDGMTLGEGAATLILETLEAAEARGATIYAEIAGFGMSADAHHITQPKAEGAAAAMLRAVEDARAPLSEVGYINAHGTGTQVNDAVEAAAIHQVFGAQAAHIPVSSTKSLTGHSIGATGALEAMATILGLQRGLLPANFGVTEIDASLQLDVILGESRVARPHLALSNSLAFGGLNAVLAIRPYLG